MQVCIVLKRGGVKVTASFRNPHPTLRRMATAAFDLDRHMTGGIARGGLTHTTTLPAGDWDMGQRADVATRDIRQPDFTMSTCDGSSWTLSHRRYGSRNLSRCELDAARVFPNSHDGIRPMHQAGAGRRLHYPFVGVAAVGVVLIIDTDT